MLSPAILGGILLVVGAYFTMSGKVMIAVGVYFIADCCWVFLAFQSGDFIGSVFVLVGMLLGLLAFLKMNYGKMRKTLDW